MFTIYSSLLGVLKHIALLNTNSNPWIKYYHPYFTCEKLTQSHIASINGRISTQEHLFSPLCQAASPCVNRCTFPVFTDSETKV